MAGENTYTQWIDGRPVIRPTSDGKLDDWMDGEPLIVLDGDDTPSVAQPIIWVVM